jgi:hypothetical protein
VILDTVFLFPEYDLVIENWLFPIGLTYSVVQLARGKNALWLIAPVFLLFIWEITDTVLLHGSTATDEIMYLLRILKLPVVFVISASIINTPVSDPDKIVRPVFYVLAVLNLIMVIDPFGIGEELQLAYTNKPTEMFSSFNEPGYFRLSGTFRNPNDNAFLMGLFLLFFLTHSIREYWKETLIGVMLILLTQSRTALIAVLASLSVAAVIPVIRGAGKRTWVYLSGIMLMLIIMVLAKPHNLYSLVNGDAFRSYSWNARMNLFIDFWDSPTTVLLTGHGSISKVREYFGLYLDSEYSAVLYQFGIVGLVLWFALWFVPLMYSKGSLKLILFMVFVSLISVTNYTIHNPLIAPLLFAFLPFFVTRENMNWMIPAIKKPDIP